MLSHMGDVLRLIWWAVIGLFRSKTSLETEILTLRHQLNVLRRKSPKRMALGDIDRVVLIGLYRLAVCTENLNPNVAVMKPTDDWV